MWLNETFQLKYPLIQGGMAQVATPAFAAAVCEAGAMGVIGTGAMKAEAVKRAIAELRALTNRPFGVNLMLMNPEVDAIAGLLAEEKVPLITTGAGNPGQYIPRWHEAGCRVIPVVSALSLAERMQKAGADAVVAEGQEAGGHVGELTSMVLWPQLARNLDIPVIGAGGVAGPDQLRAGLALGVEGFQVGTLMLATEECPIHDRYKQAVIRARGSQITVLGRIEGVPCRVMKNALCRRYLERERAGAGPEELERMLLGSLRLAVQTGDLEQGCFMMGLAAVQIDRIRPLRQLLQELFEGMELPGAAERRPR